jgi:hypothetical protein
VVEVDDRIWPFATDPMFEGFAATLNRESCRLRSIAAADRARV